MTPVLLGIGSNVQREFHVRAAVHALEQAFQEVRLSKVYESEAAGFEGPPFYNLVAWIETEQSLEALNAWCKAVEYQHGRPLNAERFTSKTLDIDILLYGQCCDEATATTPKLPRDEILTQAYLLKPLAELAPLLKHPETQKSFRQHWREFSEQTTDTLLIRTVPLSWR